MLIGIDASRANKEHKTGTEWYSYFMLKNLAKLDKKNQYILYTDRPLEKGLLDLTAEKAEFQTSAPKYDKDGFQIITSPHNNFKAKILKWPFKHFWTLGRMSLECIFHPVDILFIPSHILPMFHPRKSIVTIHDVGFIKNKSLYKQEQIGPEGRKARLFINLFARAFTLGKYGAEATDYLRWSSEFALKHSKQVITVSKSSYEDILQYCTVKKEKIKVIYNGYDEKRYQKITNQTAIDAVLNKYGITAPYLLYVGRIEKKKNIPALIEAFAILRDRYRDIKYKLVLVGDAFYGYDEVHYLIEEYNLDDEVLLPGWVSEEDMPYIYSGAGAFVFPSNYEAFGISLLEAMACGLPIAASDIASIAEVLAGAGLLFDHKDIYSMAEAMKLILTDDNLRQRLIAGGSERVKNFSWQKCAEETLALINSL